MAGSGLHRQLIRVFGHKSAPSTRDYQHPENQRFKPQTSIVVGQSTTPRQGGRGRWSSCQEAFAVIGTVVRRERPPPETAKAADSSSSAAPAAARGAFRSGPGAPPVSTPPRGRPAMPAPCTTPQLAGSVASSGILGTPRLSANVETPSASMSYLPLLLTSMPCCTTCNEDRCSSRPSGTILAGKVRS